MTAATYERDGYVATVTYNRPEALNAVNGAMRRALDEAWTAFREDTEAWVAIVTGAGRGTPWRMRRSGRPIEWGRPDRQ